MQVPKDLCVQHRKEKHTQLKRVRHAVYETCPSNNIYIHNIHFILNMSITIFERKFNSRKMGMTWSIVPQTSARISYIRNNRERYRIDIYV